MSRYDEFVEKLKEHGLEEKDWGLFGFPNNSRVVDLNVHEFAEKGENNFIIRSNIDSFEVDTFGKNFADLLEKLSKD